MILILLAIPIFIALVYGFCAFIGVAFLGSIVTGTNRKFGRGKQGSGRFRVACPSCRRAVLGPPGVFHALFAPKLW